MGLVAGDEEDYLLCDVKVIVRGDAFHSSVDGIRDVEVILEIVEVDLDFGDAIIQCLVVVT